MKIKVLVLGSWQKSKAIKFKKEAKMIGELLAMLNFELTTGGGQGASNFVAQWYKKKCGLKFTVYLPSDREQKRVGESQGVNPDKIIKTKMDYPERNILMIKKCDVIIALGGGLGTLAEIIIAVKDYKKRVFVINKGEIVDWIKIIPELKKQVIIIKADCLNNEIKM